MLKQGTIRLGNSTAFIDRCTPGICEDGNPCDTNGDTYYVIDGVRYRERDFKEYRRFTPQFRNRLIMDNARENGQSITEVSCSCSRCGAVAIDEAYWV